MSIPATTTAGGRACFESIYGPPAGKFIPTSHGTTHVILQASDNQKKSNDKTLVVLIHGIGGHAGLLDDIAADLVATGPQSQVLRYDLYDRGYSESDLSKYPIVTPGVHPLEFSLDLHIQQLRDIFEKLELTTNKLILCGHSTGGVTALGYASHYPEHVQGLILMDTVCLPMNPPIIARLANSFLFDTLMGLPIVGSFLQKVGVKGFMKFVRDSLANPSEMTPFLEKMEQNVRDNPRYFAAVRSTNLHCLGFAGTSAEDHYRACCKAKIPIHLIWGQADFAVPYEHCVQLKHIAEELGTTVTEKSFEGIPHNVFFPDAKPKEVSNSICDFVKSKIQA